DFDGGPSGQGRVYECGADGKERWRIEGVQGPADAQVLPSGRVLIAEHNGTRVTERTREGKVVWEQRVTGNPVTCQRLANGNTFIATHPELRELPGKEKGFYPTAKPSAIYCPKNLPSGNTLYIHNNSHIVEVQTTGKEARTTPAGNTAGWGSVELLP